MNDSIAAGWEDDDLNSLFDDEEIEETLELLDEIVEGEIIEIGDYMPEEFAPNLPRVGRERKRTPKTERQLQDWRSKNRDKVRASNQRARAKKLGAKVIDFGVEHWQLLLKAYDSRCAYCGEQTKYLYPDHVIPLSRGGNHTITNIVPSCPDCNHFKGGYTPEEAGMKFMVSVNILEYLTQTSLFEDDK